MSRIRLLPLAFASGLLTLCGLHDGALPPAHAVILHGKMPKTGEVVCNDTAKIDNKTGQIPQVPCPDTVLFGAEGWGPVEDHFRQKQYAKLDALFERWCTGADRFPDGRWKLTMFEDGMVGHFSMWKAWPQSLDNVKAWQKSNPSSMAAVIAEAIYWKTYAWQARGSGYVDSVSPEAWRLFGERMTRAWEAVERALPMQSACPAVYPVALKIASVGGAPEKFLRSIYDEATRRFPQYHAIYFAMAQHYLPKWGGSAKAFERFAMEAARATRSFEGMGMYARIYWTADDRSGLPFDPRKNVGPTWTTLRAGFDDLMKRYPSSIHNLGQYLSVACRSSDSALYRSLRSRIDGYQDDNETANSPTPVEVCDRQHGWPDGQFASPAGKPGTRATSGTSI